MGEWSDCGNRHGIDELRQRNFKVPGEDKDHSNEQLQPQDGRLLSREAERLTWHGQGFCRPEGFYGSG